jgi:hypothetical protein
LDANLVLKIYIITQLTISTLVLSYNEIKSSSLELLLTSTGVRIVLLIIYK